MKKQTVILGISLLLNILLIIGFLYFKNYMRSQTFRIAAINSDGNVKRSRFILSTIESGDPNKIDLLKERLRITIETEEWNADALRGAIPKKNSIMKVFAINRGRSDWSWWFWPQV